MIRWRTNVGPGHQALPGGGCWVRCWRPLVWWPVVAEGVMTSPPGDQTLSVGPASLAGDWLSRLCTPAGTTRSLKLRLRVVQAGDNAIAYSQTFVRYDSSDCSGTGTADARSTSLGTVTFSRSDATTQAAANWGLWVLPNGVQSGAIWGKKGRDSALCIGATDRAFSSLNTLSAVSAWMDLSDASCHDRL